MISSALPLPTDKTPQNAANADHTLKRALIVDE
jgi:hypothetical protein